MPLSLATAAVAAVAMVASTSSPPPPPSPAWVALEQHYTKLRNASCVVVLRAAPELSDTDATSFMAAYAAFDGTSSENGVVAAAVKILTAEAVDRFLGAPNTFNRQGLDNNMVTCAVLSEATPAGLASFAVVHPDNAALITKLLGDATLMRDMLVAGGAKAAKENPGHSHLVAQYGPAMQIYTAILQASTVLNVAPDDPAEEPCTFIANCDYGHGSREMAMASTRDACCTACATRDSCAAGVWDGTNCWFKSAEQVAAGCQPQSRALFACVEKSIKPGPAPPPVADPWDSRDQQLVLSRMALGTALEHAVPINVTWGSGGAIMIDPVARYMHYEAAYKAGDLDPAFEVLTAFELRYVTASWAGDYDLAWARTTMSNYRPDNMVYGDYHWRYAQAVNTDVGDFDPVWPDGRPDYQAVAAAGGGCGFRPLNRTLLKARFGRFCKRAFGLPTWGAISHGRALMTSWSPIGGWAVQLSDGWRDVSWENRGGLDFHLEAGAREFRGEFQRVLRAGWLGTARGEANVDPSWGTPNGPGGAGRNYGHGGLWHALALYAKKYSVDYVHNHTIPERTIGPAVVPTKIAALINKSLARPVIPSVSYGPDGTITVPAVACTSMNRSALIRIMASADAGYQLLHEGGGPTVDPASTAWSYEVLAERDMTTYLTANFTTWHMQTSLTLRVTGHATLLAAAASIRVPVFYTVGYWNQTQAVAVNLTKGINVLTFQRAYSSWQIAFKDFFLYPSKPAIRPPPSNHTPTPLAPSPPGSDYIRLPAGTSCGKQGLVDLTAADCQLASAFFKLNNTRAQNLTLNYGCRWDVAGQHAGSVNFNTNMTAGCCNPQIRSICFNTPCNGVRGNGR